MLRLTASSLLPKPPDCAQSALRRTDAKGIGSGPRLPGMGRGDWLAP